MQNAECRMQNAFCICHFALLGSTTMSEAANVPPAQESYIVHEGKKRGSTRDVRPEAAYDRYYTVLKVHAGDAILNDNWHTNEVLTHTKANFEGYTFAMRTLEAWGAMIESDRR